MTKAQFSKFAERDWDGTIAPYIDWWIKTRQEKSLDNSMIAVLLSKFIVPYEKDALMQVRPRTGLEESPIPADHPAYNPGFKPEDPWLPDTINATAPPSGTVIVGIVDEDISLSHDRFIDADGNPRILAAWQQGARFDGQSYLPFGRELYQHDIKDKIDDCTSNGQFDQDLFNERAGLVDMTYTNGSRGLKRRAAHGTHVADLAAGGADTAIMVTNLPDRKAVGLSGTFLEVFYYLGVVRMIHIADRLWSTLEHKPEGPQGYPMVFNLSFAKTAGARDALTGLSKAIAAINKKRANDGKSRVYFSLPAGNDNLTESVGRFELPSGRSRQFKVDVPPEDYSDSYLEIWTRKLQAPASARNPPLAIDVALPGQEPRQPQVGGNGTVSDLRDATGLRARLYATAFGRGTAVDATENGDLETFLKGFDKPFRDQALRQRYVLAMGPSQIANSGGAVVPAGLWTITLHNTGGETLTFDMAVQTDLPTSPSSRSSRKPRLIDAEYRRYRANGEIRDSYSYGPNAPEDLDRPDPLDVSRYVFRHGSLNALSSALITARGRHEFPYIFVSTGHRRTDGKPAIYASTGHEGVPDGAPDVSLPTEDSATAPGILAAGAQRGKNVALSGTSFAAAQTTRLIAEVLQGLKSGAASHTVDVLTPLIEAGTQDYGGQVNRLKSGKARLPGAQSPSRLTPELP